MTNLQPLSTVGEKSVGVRPVTFWCSIVFFIFMYLFTHEVTVIDSLLLSLTLVIDVATGTLIWVILTKKAQYSATELFAVGFSIGSSVNAVVQVLFRNFILADYIGYLLLLLALVAYFTLRRTDRVNFNVASSAKGTECAIFATCLLLLAADRYYLWVSSLLFYAIFLVLTNRRLARLSDLPGRLIWFVGPLAIALPLLASSLFESIRFGRRSVESYISGWDGVIFEASSKALLRYGPFDHIFLANIKYAYYWLHDAWAGALTQRSHVGDWVVTTQFGPLLVALAVAGLLFEIVKHRISDQRTTWLLVGVVCASSLLGAPSVLVSLASFSQTVAVLWVVLILFLVDDYFRNEKIGTLAGLVFFICLLTMTKLTTAVPVIAGLAVATLFLKTLRVSTKSTSRLLISTTVATALSFVLYLVFIKPEASLAQSYFDVTWQVSSDALGIVVGVVAIDIVLFALPKFTALMLAWHRLNLKASFNFLLAAISLTSLAVSFFLKFELTVANTYTLLPFLISFSLIIGFGAAQTISAKSMNQKYHRFFLVAISIAGSAAGAATTFRLHDLNYQFVTQRQSLLLSFLVPIGALVALLTLIYLASRLKKVTTSYTALSLVFVLALAPGSYFVHSLREEQKQMIYRSNGWPLIVEEDVVGKIVEIQPAMDFLADNLTYVDVIASNSTKDNGLLAGMTGIRNYASSYVVEMQGVADRFAAQFEFARNPSPETYRALREGCVTWFYFVRDENNTELSAFATFADVRFADEFGAVLQLKESLQLPKRCFD